MAEIILYVVLGLILIVVLWAIMTYNALIKLKNMVEEGWSGIDVQLKRRANLIPNLIEAVKGYMGHEKDLLTRVTELRAQALATDDPAAKAPLEQALTGLVGRIIAVAENYPDLKASQNFQDLQTQLADVENQIQMSRRYYNGTVRNLNIKVESFPSNIIANMFKFVKAEFFEIEDPAERAVPEVKF